MDWDSGPLSLSISLSIFKADGLLRAFYSLLQTPNSLEGASGGLWDTAGCCWVAGERVAGGQLVSGGRHSQCEEQIVCASCIHSWGLRPPPLVLARKRLRLHAEMFPCHLHPTLSAARCLPKFSTTPLCCIFKGNRPAIAQGASWRGGAGREGRWRKGWSNPEGVRYSVLRA